MEAFVVIDFVNDLVDPDGKLAKLGTPQHVLEQGAIDHARSALNAARGKRTKVIFVRVGFGPDFAEIEGLNAPFYKAHKTNDWLIRGTWGTEFHPALQPMPDETVVEKCRVNPFTNPQFEEALSGIDRIVLVGVSTNLAVEETVRNAAAKGYDVTVLVDCCASNNAQMHEFSVTNILSKFATIANSEAYANE